MLRPPPTPTLFPYTTLFRSGSVVTAGHKIDFTDRVTIGRRTIIGGRNSSLWTHNRQRTLPVEIGELDRKSTRLNSSHVAISYAVFCLKKKKKKKTTVPLHID